MMWSCPVGWDRRGREAIGRAASMPQLGKGTQNSMGLIQERQLLGLTVGKKGKKVLENGSSYSELATYLHAILSFWTLQILEGSLVCRCQCLSWSKGNTFSLQQDVTDIE